MSSSRTLGWEGKMEPLSPFFSDADDLWIFEDDFTTDLQLGDEKGKNFSYEGISKARMAELLLKELDDVKGEPFSQWLEEKIDLPFFDDFPVPIPVVTARKLSEQLPVQHLKQEYAKPQQTTPYTAPLSPPMQPLQHSIVAQDTESLLLEFESVYGAVEFNHLTPPQSPPYYPAASLQDPVCVGISQNFQLQPVQQFPNNEFTYVTLPVTKLEVHHSVLLPFSYEIQSLELGANEVASPQPDVAKELAAVDELLRSRSYDLPEDIAMWTDSDSVSSDLSPEHPSPEYSIADSPETPVLRALSPSLSTNSSCSMSEAEEEWRPEPTKSSRGAKKRPGKPYARQPADKKSRKKEQNKNAATRYRQKKKAEIEEILGEEKELMDVHDDLKGQCDELSREIKYLKGLMKDLLKAKGMI